MKSTVLIILTVLFCLGTCTSLNLCGDWLSYKDAKCIAVLKMLATEMEAYNNCTARDPNATLLKVESKEEQAFVIEHIKRLSTYEDRAWIGLVWQNGAFRWLDGTDPDQFAPWSDDSNPKTIAMTDGQCTQLSLVTGKWTNEYCNKKALVLCQKKQELSLSVLRQAFESVNRDVLVMKSNVTNLDGIVKQLSKLNNTELDGELAKLAKLYQMQEKALELLNKSVDFHSFLNISRDKIQAKFDRSYGSLNALIDEITRNAADNGNDLNYLNTVKDELDYWKTELKGDILQIELDILKTRLDDVDKYVAKIKAKFDKTTTKSTSV